jgi:adenylate cyclase
MERKLAAILAADVVGYSRLMEQDEAKTFERLKDHRIELVEPEIATHHGCVFKLMGDGLLAEFGSVVDAVECAVDIQRGMAERDAGLPQDQRIEIRIGINLGEVIVEGADRHGEGVNMAARLQQLADPGGICVSGKVAKEVEKKLAFGFEPMGEQKVKNISEPIPVYRVKLDGAPAPRRRTRSKSRLTDWARPIAAAMVLLAGLVAASWYGLMRSPSHLAGAHVPSIAVLPFDDLSPDKSLSYLGDGVSEDIITMLSRFPDVTVIARNSSFVYKGKPVDMRQIGRDLNVGYALEGSVRNEADQIRITAQLIDTQTGNHVWAERYDKSGKDALALQDEVTGKIVGAMTGETGQIKRGQYQDAWGKDTTDLGEYDYYLRGHDVFMNFTKADNDRAEQIWEEGLAKYPDSNLLKVKLGWYHFNAGWYLWSDDIPSDYRKAGELVRTVLAKENLSPQVKRLAHWLFAFVLVSEGDFSRALKEADTAIALAPYDAFMIGNLAQIAIMSGKPDKGLEWIDFARTHDPNGLKQQNYNKGWALRILGKYEDSVAAFRQSFYPDGDAPLHIAVALFRLGQIIEAKAEVKLMLEKNDPKFTQAKWREGYFYSDSSIMDSEVADLAKAGLPEK